MPESGKRMYVSLHNGQENLLLTRYSDAQRQSSDSCDLSMESAINKPTRGGARISQVQFRHVFRYFKLPMALYDTPVGEFVIVQSLVNKSHEDLGIITKILSMNEYEEVSGATKNIDNIDETKLGRVLRIASPEELQYLPMKYQREHPLLHICQNYSKRHHMIMNITGVDYQFDGNVLFVYYTADERVDYRPMVKFLIKMYCPNCRIQMKNTEGCPTFQPIAWAAEALVTGKHVKIT